MRMSGSSRSIRVPYAHDGLDEDGERIPDIPILYLTLRSERGRARGPAIVDTGFDGGIYPNIKVIKILEGLKPLRVKRIESPLYEPIECEIYSVEAALLDRGSGRQIPLGTVNLYVPTEPEYLSNEVLIGREILNKLELRLNGRWTEIKTR